MGLFHQRAPETSTAGMGEATGEVGDNVRAAPSDHCRRCGASGTPERVVGETLRRGHELAVLKHLPPHSLCEEFDSMWRIDAHSGWDPAKPASVRQ